MSFLYEDKRFCAWVFTKGKKMTRQIFAMGDGGLDGKNPMVDLYILAQTKKSKTKNLSPSNSPVPDSRKGLIKYFYSLYERYRL